jgi:tRNA (guanosine-2'-O-)-methyltransferase
MLGFLAVSSDLNPAEMLLADRKRRVDEVVSRRTRNLTVVLEEVEDPHNLAAVLRTCEAFGIQDVHVVESEKARFYPNAKITQGAEKWLDLLQHRTVVDCIDYLHERGFKVFATSPKPGATSLYDLSFEGKLAMLFGNEVDGVTQRAIAHADGTFWVPMRGMVPSMNISVAAAVSVAQGIFMRHRRLGDRGDLSPAESAELSERFYKLAVKQRDRIFGEAD